MFIKIIQINNVLKCYGLHKAVTRNLIHTSAAAKNAGKGDASAPQKETEPHAAEEALSSLLEDDRPRRPGVDPKNTTIVVFPGQGTQYVGMAKQLMRFPKARSLFKLASEVLKYDLAKVCTEGPAEMLNRTEFSQPAVLVSSLAALEQLREERPNAIDTCVATAGFSLGELTALVFAGALPFDKALQLVQVRAMAMQAACDKAAGGMAMLLYGPNTNVSEACSKALQWCIDNGLESPYCGIAGYMYPHCKVVAGNIEALEFLETNSRALKIKRVMRLPVNGAFHTPLMEEAVEIFAQALRKVRIENPIISVYSNVDGKAYKNATHILKQLPKQILRPVKWEQTLHHMYGRQQGMDFPRTFECGPGKGLRLILEKVNAKAANSAFNVEA